MIKFFIYFLRSKEKLKILSSFFEMFSYLFGIKKREGTLVYVGLNKGHSFLNICFKYKHVYGFEPNRELSSLTLSILQKFPGIHIHNKAVSDKNGIIEFNISSNDGASSSIGKFKEEWPLSDKIKMTKTIRVESINLMDFLRENHIDQIDCYISDIQGYDLQVLQTLKPMIDEKKIKTITCETGSDKYNSSYADVPDNSFSGFKKLLEKNYRLAATGYGSFIENESFMEINDDTWEFDSKWVLKE